MADGYGLEAYFMAPNESRRRLRLEANFMAMTGGVSGLPLGAMLMAVAGVLRRFPYNGPAPQRLVSDHSKEVVSWPKNRRLRLRW